MSDVQVSVQQIGDTPTSQGFARDHRVLVDRPPAKGGADRGPLGGEMMLLSLGGCYMSTLIAAARARDLDPSDLHVTVQADIGGNPQQFQTATMTVYGQTADEATLQKAIEIAERSCLVTNTLKGSMAISVRRAQPEEVTY